MTPDDRAALKKLTDAFNALAEHRFVRIHNSTPRLIWYQFLRGLAFGFGTVIGASLLVSIAVFALTQIELIPLIGDYAKQIIEEIDAGRR